MLKYILFNNRTANDTTICNGGHFATWTLFTFMLICLVLTRDLRGTLVATKHSSFYGGKGKCYLDFDWIISNLLKAVSYLQTSVIELSLWSRISIFGFKVLTDWHSLCCWVVDNQSIIYIKHGQMCCHHQTSSDHLIEDTLMPHQRKKN